jgi:hypothetical protein
MLGCQLRLSLERRAFAQPRYIASCNERRVDAHFFCRFNLKLGEAGFGKCSNAEVRFGVKLTVVRRHYNVLFPVKYYRKL